MADSDDKPLTIKEFLDLFMTSLKMIGAAHATGAIACGAAYTTFAVTLGVQPAAKSIILIFLFGLLMYTISYTTLLVTIIKFDHFVTAIASSKSETNKPVSSLIKGVKRPLAISMIFAGISAVLFFAAMAWIIEIVIRI